MLPNLSPTYTKYRVNTNVVLEEKRLLLEEIHILELSRLLTMFHIVE